MADDGLADAIQQFLLNEGLENNVPPPREPEPDHTPDPVPRHNMIKFTYEGEDFVVEESGATPSAVADHFDLDLNEIQLTRHDRTFSVNATENKFVPNVRVGKKYTISKIEVRQPPTPTPRRTVENANLSGNQCTLVLNNERKTCPAGKILRNQIAALFNRRINDIRLIGADGIVKNNSNQYDLNPGATYYLKTNDQERMQKPLSQVGHDDSDENFSKPFAFMTPFMTTVVRILYALSLTNDSVKFETTEDDDKKQKPSNLHCSTKLSTCAYQVAYRFNTALEAILKFSIKLSEDEFSNSLLEFLPSSRSNETNQNRHYQSVPIDLPEEPNKTQAFFEMVSSILESLEKAHSELEELLQIIVTKMRHENPSIQSVKTSLKVETNQEKRDLEKEARKKADDSSLTNSCYVICHEYDDIRPKSNDLYTITSSRSSINVATELLDKILFELSENPPLEDITALLDYCAKISHCNLMHWIFADKLWKNIVMESKKEGTVKVAGSYKNKKHVATKICFALQVWKAVSEGEPLTVNLSEEISDIHEAWNKLKEEITNCQYALEICYDDLNSDNI